MDAALADGRPTTHPDLMRACVWIAIAGVLGTLGCSATGTEGSNESYAGAPAGGSGVVAEGGAQDLAGSAPVIGGSAGQAAVASAGEAGKSGSGGGSSAGAGGKPANGGAGGTGASGGKAGAGGAPATCGDSASSTLGSCTYFVRSCLDSSSVKTTYETTDGNSFDSVSSLSQYCTQSGSGGGGAGGSGGAPTVCDPTDWCCVSQTFTQGCAATLPAGVHECGKACGVGATQKAQCAADESAVCAWHSVKQCWICH
jgi:hypothetical protein